MRRGRIDRVAGQVALAKEQGKGGTDGLLTEHGARTRNQIAAGCRNETEIHILDHPRDRGRIHRVSRAGDDIRDDRSDRRRTAIDNRFSRQAIDPAPRLGPVRPSLRHSLDTGHLARDDRRDSNSRLDAHIVSGLEIL
ncbi:MAG: hypothetical protein C0511_15325, partial [Hyphomicrobium sp.]|nr:hypothetical protein [Hyphomicrobium sp.]